MKCTPAVIAGLASAPPDPMESGGIPKGAGAAARGLRGDDDLGLGASAAYEAVRWIVFFFFFFSFLQACLSETNARGSIYSHLGGDMYVLWHNNFLSISTFSI
jgi:hypothetical protein